jgi:hypothetical protein
MLESKVPKGFDFKNEYICVQIIGFNENNGKEIFIFL